MAALRSPRFSRPGRPSPIEPVQTVLSSPSETSMRLVRVSFILGLACVTGCTTGRLRQRTINQGSHPARVAVPASPGQPRPVRDTSRLPAVARQPQGGDLPGHRLDFGGCGGGPRPAGHLVPAAPRLEDRRGPVGDVAGDRCDRAAPAPDRLSPRPRRPRYAVAQVPRRAGPRAEGPVRIQRRPPQRVGVVLRVSEPHQPQLPGAGCPRDHDQRRHRLRRPRPLRSIAPRWRRTSAGRSR